MDDDYHLGEIRSDTFWIRGHCATFISLVEFVWRALLDEGGFAREFEACLRLTPSVESLLSMWLSRRSR